MGDRVRDTIISSYGESAEGFLELAGPKREEVLRESVQHFRERTDLPSWDADDSQSVPLGGDYPNEVLIGAPVQLGGESWEKILASSASMPIEVEEVTVTYVVQREFDPLVSRLLETPVVSYLEGMVAVAHRGSESRPEASVLSIDHRGVRELLYLPNVEPTEPTPEPPDRRQRFSAYADALVGWQDAQKVYLPIERAEQIDPPKLERDDESLAFPASRWEALTLGDPTTTRPVDSESPSSRARIIGPGTVRMRRDGWDGPDEGEDPPGSGAGASTNGGTYNTGTAIVAGGVSGVIGIEATAEGDTG